jgi:hypothetical protein
MIATFVTFRYGDDFDEQRVRKVAAAASQQFTGMAGLRSKLFSVSPAQRLATNVYVWDSDQAARAFFSDELRARVTGLYGVAPTVEFAEVAALVDNH